MKGREGKARQAKGKASEARPRTRTKGAVKENTDFVDTKGNRVREKEKAENKEKQLMVQKSTV